MDTVDKILELLKIPKKTQKGLSEAIGMKAPNLNKILKRADNRTLSAEQLLKAAQYFGVDASYFSLDNDDKKPVARIPVVGTTSCGSPDINMSYDNSRTCYYNGEYYKESLYCVIANGDSMSPEIEDGDEIVCDPDVKPQHGDIVHYTIGDESAVKVYVEDKEAYIVQFIPYNGNEHFKTKTVRLDDEDTMRELKISKVVAVNKLKFNNRNSRLRLIGRA